MKYLSILLCAGFLASCTVETTQQPTTQKPPETQAPKPAAPKVTQTASQGVAGYQRVAKRVEPVAESICRSFSKDQRAGFCDFQLKVDQNPKAPPNAYQSIGRDGRPVITFNINMLRTVKNDHEVAFIMGHEAGHQIARHLLQKRNNAQAGAILGAILVGAAGGNPQSGADLGGFIGAQSYSKAFELQADRIGAHIAYRSGYDPLIGARSFQRTGGSNSLLSTHPPGPDRYQTVVRTVQEIKAARAQGKQAPIVWK